MSKSKKPKKPDSHNSITRASSIELCLEHGINLQTKSLSLSGDVNEEMYDATMAGLSVLNQFQGVKSITIRLNTGGGDTYQALGIFDLIKFNKVPVDVVATGLCMSAGLVIMQAARRRLATPFAQLMCHFGNDAPSGTYRDVQRFVAHRQELEDQIMDVFLNRCNWHTEQYEKLHQHDSYFSAKDALKMGLIDEVVS